MATQSQQEQGTSMPNISKAEMQDAFSSFAANYEKLTGGVTRQVVEKGLALLPPITSSSVVHDNACGPGVVTGYIIKTAAAKGSAPPRIEATDFAKGMIDCVQNDIKKNGWTTVHAQVRDMSDLGCFKDGTFTHSITNFGLFALPDAVKGAREIRRTLKDDGVAMVTVWKDVGNMKIVHGAQRAIRPDLPVFEPASPDWYHEWKLKGVMEEAGFSEVKMHQVPNWWMMGGVEGFMEMFTNPFWDIVQKEWSEEEKKRWPEECLKQLTEEQKRDKRIKADAWVCVARK